MRSIFRRPDAFERRANFTGVLSEVRFAMVARANAGDI
ncbi:hypothetical protein FHS84_000047 [Rhizomicrobium electricum]|nr:hypothetical protein [Rhizomicrobium electricum]